MLCASQHGALIKGRRLSRRSQFQAVATGDAPAMLALVWLAPPSIAIGSPVATSAKSSPPAAAKVAQTPSEWHRHRAMSEKLWPASAY